MCVGIGIGVLFAAILPVWPAVLAGNDFGRAYTLWTALPTMEVEWSLLLPAGLTVIFAFGGAFVGLSIAQRFEDERAARLASEGRCLRCGYMLTGNNSGVCPECGTPVANATLDAGLEHLAVPFKNNRERLDRFIVGCWIGIILSILFALAHLLSAL